MFVEPVRASAERVYEMGVVINCHKKFASAGPVDTYTTEGCVFKFQFDSLNSSSSLPDDLNIE